MLILTRRPGERVVIGGEVFVTILDVSGQTVRVGIAAPEGIPVYREEIWLAVTEENRAAAEAAGDALRGAPALATVADPASAASSAESGSPTPSPRTPAA
jgi:carbon storage regulator